MNMINRKSPRVERVIEILDRLPKLPPPDEDEDFAVVWLLTNGEITQVKRHLEREEHNPGLTAHMRRARELFPTEQKFDVRQVLLGLAISIVNAQAQEYENNGVTKPRKLHEL